MKILIPYKRLNAALIHGLKRLPDSYDFDASGNPIHGIYNEYPAEKLERLKSNNVPFEIIES